MTAILHSAGWLGFLGTIAFGFHHIATCPIRDGSCPMNRRAWLLLIPAGISIILISLP